MAPRIGNQYQITVANGTGMRRAEVNLAGWRMADFAPEVLPEPATAVARPAT
jgi:hypothetical protein